MGRMCDVIVLLLVCYVSSVYGQGRYCPASMIQLYNGVVCQNDQTCQMQSNGFFCYQGYCCANSVTMPGGYGSMCTYDSECNFINSQCTNNFCYCQYGYKFDGQNCGFNTLPGGDSGPCSSGQVSIQGLCYNRVGYRGFCSFSQQCSYANGVCVQGRCVCQTGQIYDGTECVNDPDLPAASNCNSNEVYINGACYGTSLPGQACIYDQQCIGGSNQRCFTGLCTDCSNGQCGSATTCTGNQALINGRCYPLVGPGQACTYTQQCTSLYQDRGMLCQNGVCQFNDRGNPLIPRTGDPICKNPNAQVERVGGVPKNCVYQTCSPGYACEYNIVYNGGQYICCGAGPGSSAYGNIKMYPGYTNLPLQCTAVNSCTFVDYPYCVYSTTYQHNVCCSTRQCL